MSDEDEAYEIDETLEWLKDYRAAHTQGEGAPFVRQGRTYIRPGWLADWLRLERGSITLAKGELPRRLRDAGWSRTHEYVNGKKLHLWSTKTRMTRLRMEAWVVGAPTGSHN